VLVGGVTVDAVKPPNYDGRFLVNGKVEGQNCSILLDSGASATVVSSSLLGGKWKLRRVSKNSLRTANNTFLPVLGKQRCWIEIAGNRAFIDVYVAEKLSSPCILGVDGLKTLKVVLDFRQQEKRALSGEKIIGSMDIDFGQAKGEEYQMLKSLLEEYSDLFGKVVPGAAKEVQHEIKTKEHEPISCKGKRIPLLDQKMIEKHVQEMLRDGVISPSQSPYRFPVVMVDKKDGKKRFCINYFRLNEVTIKNRYPLPRVDDLLDHTSGSKFFCVLDMSSAYWQVPLAKEDRWKTAFSTPSGHYQFNVMPFGLCNAPATQQESMIRTFRGLEKVHVLLDDVIVHGKTIAEVLERLRKVFQRMRERNLKLHMKKCHFMKTSVIFLGHVISGDGLEIDKKKVVAIENFPPPKNSGELRTFLGMCAFLKKFVKNFAGIAKPLFDLTRKNHVWCWTEECQEAFHKLKQKMMSPPILV
jgi:hypothetical protein